MLLLQRTQGIYQNRQHHKIPTIDLIQELAIGSCEDSSKSRRISTSRNTIEQWAFGNGIIRSVFRGVVAFGMYLNSLSPCKSN